MQTKYLLLALGILVLVTLGVGVYTIMGEKGTEGLSREIENEVKPIPPSPMGGGKLKAETFTGTLELVDTGCFADGECYVTVDGKHVTALMGWSRDTVGSVVGVEGFGDLEQYVGQKVEVYAQVTGEGQYTLYGSEGFYIKPVTSAKNGVVGDGDTSAASNSLEGKTFVWEKTIETNKSVTTPKQKDAFTFTLQEGQVRGGTDCNGYSGTVVLEGKTITMGAFMSTMMYCEGSQESAFTNALTRSVTYRFEGEKLVLSGTSGYPEVWLSPQTSDDETRKPVRGGCMVGGCSGQLCVDAKTGGDMVTTCEYREEYACYQGATCERQATGQCGWTQTKELSQCLLGAENASSSMKPEVN